MIALDNVGKTFIMHLQGGTRLPAVRHVKFDVSGGECVVLAGRSGAGKSSLIKMIYGNYRCDEGSILIQAPAERVDVAKASPRRVIRLRRETLGYVSQFLRVIPRVSALDIVAESAREQGASRDEAITRAEAMLRRLNLPERLWALPPATFSGGEQQRVNIARGFIAKHPILLLDEPTASLDQVNRSAFIELVREKKREGVAMLGIFHDEDVRQLLADRVVDVSRFSVAA
jgi:alpha-D-ribose 1-methylphosphonate 5-triphosphate synthase subunit PhnL